ncbi:FAD-binding protein [Anaeromyxobacter terrae]|uniref:FAD-binding protein n=1 Tax=Anaeromyxobacter terrae TaxID=2925406 RepID=UPI001F57DC88|nr:FAD-binding protein [Anaeromyxobacter sp. SG22]
MSPRAVAADVLVVGGGMAGAIAALAAREAGARVVLARRAPGATALSSGAIGVAPDPLALPGEPLRAAREPLEAARRLARLRPDHPYAVLGERLGALPEALAFAARVLAPLLAPPLERPRFLATPFGTAVPAALCQRSQAAGDLLAVDGALVVAGLRGHLGLDAALAAAGLERYRARGGPRAFAVEVDPGLGEVGLFRPHELARALEPPGAAEALGRAIRAALPAGAGAALVPPVLGLRPEARVPERVAAAAGIPVAELLADVPSVPGVRLQAALEAALAAAGVEVVQGALQGAGPGKPAMVGADEITAPRWVLATGRFVGGGVVRRGTLREPVLGLPVQAAEGREAGVDLAARPAASLTGAARSGPQPLLSAGLRVDALLRPLDGRGRPAADGLFAAGAVLGGHEQASDGTGLGVAILTGYLAGRAAARPGGGE